MGRHSYVLNLAVAWLSRAVHDDPNDREKKSVNLRYDLLLPGGTVVQHREPRP